jgi:hypothetical protein
MRHSFLREGKMNSERSYVATFRKDTPKGESYRRRRFCSTRYYLVLDITNILAYLDDPPCPKHAPIAN